MTNTTTANQTAIIDYLSGVESATSTEIRTELGMSPGAASGTLSSMSKRGMIAKRVDDNGAAHWSAVEAAKADPGTVTPEAPFGTTHVTMTAPDPAEHPATPKPVSNKVRQFLEPAIAEAHKRIAEGAEYELTPSGKFAKAVKVGLDAWVTTDGRFISAMNDKDQWVMYRVDGTEVVEAETYAGAGTGWKVEEIERLRG